MYRPRPQQIPPAAILEPEAVQVPLAELPPVRSKSVSYLVSAIGMTLSFLAGATVDHVAVKQPVVVIAPANPEPTPSVQSTP